MNIRKLDHRCARKVAPVVICTHDSEKTLQVIEENSVCIFDERDFVK
ncbi:hypothetical protein [Clostridium botulinum]|nr:hypothetical protein [Clostridium botulinum]KAI3344573.1 hypothetical protein CIT18_17285 [Clostridium botulinum]